MQGEFSEEGVGEILGRKDAIKAKFNKECRDFAKASLLETKGLPLLKELKESLSQSKGVRRKYLETFEDEGEFGSEEITLIRKDAIKVKGMLLSLRSCFDQAPGGEVSERDLRELKRHFEQASDDTSKEYLEEVKSTIQSTMEAITSKFSEGGKGYFENARLRASSWEKAEVISNEALADWPSLEEVSGIGITPVSANKTLEHLEALSSTLEGLTFESEFVQDL